MTKCANAPRGPVSVAANGARLDRSADDLPDGLTGVVVVDCLTIWLSTDAAQRNAGRAANSFVLFGF
jgi:hypothetical protein